MSGTLLSGNEAIARGAWEAGALVGVGYPGTPSTETLESFRKLPGVVAQWAPNEKVALEVAAGVSMGGARVLVTMKHVGVNVAADPLFTLAYTGVGGGLVILAADDPGMHSSQNEQDSRNWGPFARVPVLEPSDSAEALAFTRLAFKISERFDLPVIVRSTTRISHSKGIVTLGEQVESVASAQFTSDPAKWVMLPGNARARRVSLDRRVDDLGSWNRESGPDVRESRSAELGIVTSGVAYQYVREAMPDASIYKVAMAFPLNESALLDFASTVDKVAVVEEANPYLHTALKAMGIELAQIDLPPAGELSPGKVRKAFGVAGCPTREPFEGLPPRPPLMCPGCPHRPVFRSLSKAKAIVAGDIGCYTLGALPPLSAMDSCVCMGAGIGMAHGLALAGQGGDRPLVSVIGDSTFAHSGLTGLANVVYNSGKGTILILDNRITAMTGHQGNPIMGRTLMGEQATEIQIESVCSALGVKHVVTVDPHDLIALDAVIREEMARDALSVVIVRAPCALLIKEKEQPYAVDEDACTSCGACIKLGCPAISKTVNGKAEIDITVCVGCGDCVQVCRFDAIVSAGLACEMGGV